MDVNPHTKTNMYVSKECVQVRWDNPSDQDKSIYIIYIRDRPTQPEAIRRCPELGEVVSLKPKMCIYIYIPQEAVETNPLSRSCGVNRGCILGSRDMPREPPKRARALGEAAF